MVNPASGREISSPLKHALLDELRYTPSADSVVLTGPGQAEQIAGEAADNGYDRIIVAAGDGTINEVINGIGDSGIPIGIIPLGTGNVLAHELGIERENLQAAMAVIEAGKIREVDLGKAGDTRFLLMAGFGFDAEVVRSVHTNAKSIFGRMAYAPALVQESVKYRPVDFTLLLDDNPPLPAAAYNVIVCNCASYAPNLQIAPTASLEDGLLDVIVFEQKPAMKLRMLGWLSASLVTRWAADASATHYQAKRVRIESVPVVKMQIDGDVRGESGVDIEVLPKALRLIVP